ncbi:MAG: dockerin type I repeat-containing protein [Candidatus Zixiibacteriota bacterium]
MCRKWSSPRAWALMLGLILLFPVFAFADWEPANGHKMHFPQLPDESGWAVKAEYPNMLADDWQCSESGYIKDIHFWGAWKGGVQGIIKQFHIVIYEDIPATPTSHSRPGKVIKRIAVTNFVVRTIQPTTMEGWYDPVTATFSANDHLEYYQYNVFLRPDQWFTQEIGKIYWVGISAELVQGPVLAEWGWKSTKNHFNDDAVWGPIPCGGTTCESQDNGSGTAAQPSLCTYSNPEARIMVLNGLPPGTTIEMETELVPLSLTSEMPGGSLGGTHSESQMELKLHMSGTGTLAGLARDVVISTSIAETDQAARLPGTSPQSFETGLWRLLAQLPIGDPDFDLLRITAGTDFGMPSPGHTTLTMMSGGTWAVESFFDITYQIDFIGKPGGPLSGMSGSTTGTIRMYQGVCPTTWTDMYEPQVVLPPIQNTFQVQIDPNGQFAGGGGSDAYGQGWYTYPSQWINVWFYDHPYDDQRYKKIHIEFDLAPFLPGIPSQIEVAVNWSTAAWSLTGNPPADPRRPPLPGEDEALYISRTTLFAGTDPSGHWVYDFEIPDYNPEWVSIDVRGFNFSIPGGVITHECLPKNPPPSLDLAFVITNTGGAFGACCDPLTGFCSILSGTECQAIGGNYQGDGTSCTPNPCPPPVQTGACCKQDGTCLISTALDCGIIGGSYQGDGTPCVPNPCDCCGTDGTQIRGNANMIGAVNVVDVTFLVDYLFRQGPTPPCKEEANVNGDASINVVDLTALVQYLFAGGAGPAMCP